MTMDTLGFFEGEIVSVAIIDDHEAIRLGLEQACEDHGFRILASGDTVDGVLSKATRPPQVVLLEMELDDGSRVSDNVKKLVAAGSAVVIFSTLNKPRLLRAALRAGASAIVPKSQTMDEVADAIQRLAVGRTVNNLATVATIDADLAFKEAKLSPREREILSLFTSGLSLKQVATAIGIATGTAKDYLDQIRLKYSNLDLVVPPAIEPFHLPDLRRIRSRSQATEHISLLVIDGNESVRSDFDRYREKIGIEIVASAETVDGALFQLKKACRVAILDLSLSDASTPAENVKRLLEHVAAVLIFSDGSQPRLLQSALRAGAAGVVLKSTEVQDLALALRQVATGLVVKNHETVVAINADVKFKTSRLEPLEREVLERYAAEVPPSEIATELKILEASASHLLERVRTKFASTYWNTDPRRFYRFWRTEEAS